MSYGGGKILAILLLFFCALLQPALADPGRTASDGCHYCRTDCDKWGVAWDERHCQGGASIENTCESDASQNITKVVDGDTVEFSCGGEAYRVRIIGIDSPETAYSPKPDQCFSKEASSRMTELALGKEATLERGEGTDDKDKYNRLLRYIFVAGEDVGAEMIQAGYARSYKVYAHEKLSSYNQLEREAQEDRRGLWASEACGVEQQASAPAREAPEPSTTQAESAAEDGSIIPILLFFRWLLGLPVF